MRSSLALYLPLSSLSPHLEKGGRRRKEGRGYINIVRENSHAADSAYCRGKRFKLGDSKEDDVGGGGRVVRGTGRNDRERKKTHKDKKQRDKKKEEKTTPGSGEK